MADQKQELIYGRSLWPIQPDWKDGVSEGFEFSTQIITADSGREQRLSRRRVPRRTLGMRHTLTTADDAARYQSILRKRQWRPMLVPQWHMSVRTSRPGRVGDRTLTLANEPDASWQKSVVLFLLSGEVEMLLDIVSVAGRVVTLQNAMPIGVPVGSELMALDYGVINPDLSSSRATSNVLQAQVSFSILPQTDTRTLPPVTSMSILYAALAEQGHRWAEYIRACSMLTPAQWPTWPSLPSQPGGYTSRMDFQVKGDTRKVITRKPNWATELSITDTWQYVMVDHLNAALTPGNAEDFGKRTFNMKWTAYTYEVANDILSIFGVLRGAQVACWIPSWSNDLTAVGDMPALNRMRVAHNGVIDEGVLLNDPAVGIMIETFTDEMHCAIVTAVTTSAGVATLTLDRNLTTQIRGSNVMRISLLYRVRMASDAIEMKWLTKGVSELQASFTTVQE